MKVNAPPAPSLGTRTGIYYAGRYIGAIIGIDTRRHVAVCSHTACGAKSQACLGERPTHDLARGVLALHWRDHHTREVSRQVNP